MNCFMNLGRDRGKKDGIRELNEEVAVKDIQNNTGWSIRIITCF